MTYNVFSGTLSPTQSIKNAVWFEDVAVFLSLNHGYSALLKEHPLM